jgi:hypothetical protein
MVSMPRTKRTTQTPTPGFAIRIKDDTELGLAMLIAEDEEGHTEPIAVVATINEAVEIARHNFCAKLRRLEADKDPGLCPWVYKVWAQGIGGDYRLLREINVHTL